LFANAKLLELLELNQEYEKLNTNFEESYGLSNLSEDTLYGYYFSGIKVAGTKPFKDMSKENIEAFYRLKLRSIESRLIPIPN
jgi:hypothetical protein